MKLKLLILVLALQTAWVLYTVATQEYALATGPTVLLETQPVDPRDYLRGDYVRLNYKISTISTNMFLPTLTKMPSAGETVYVALAKQGEFHQVVRASTNWFEPTPVELILKGKTGWSWWGSTNEHMVRVEYGIERHYVSEGKGNPRGTLTVQAVVPSSHRASIKQVFVDGKPYAEAMKDQP